RHAHARAARGRLAAGGGGAGQRGGGGRGGQDRYGDGEPGRGARAAAGGAGRGAGRPRVIRSMTGYGQAAFQVDGAHFEVEVRSVNHRHLDVKVRLPRGLAGFESELRVRVAERLARGKVDLTV